MKSNSLLQALHRPIPFLLDGASGTQMIHLGMPAQVCPEQWAVQHPDLLFQMHQSYVEAGAQLIYAFTFGANPLKLKEYGLEKETAALNHALVQIAKKAAGGKAWVAGDLSPTGVFVEPLGETTLEEAISAYQVQTKALFEAGVDCFIIETMLDIQETRAAILAAKETCDLPVFASLTFDESGRTLTGTDSKTAAISLCALGVDGIGANCGMGPASMKQIIADMASVATVPVFAKPNAGLPSGETLSPDAFALEMMDLIAAGAKAVGGCCGTSPAYIQKIKALAAGKSQPLLPKETLGSVVSSVSQSVALGAGQPLRVIGERINPTGKKRLQQALLENDDDYILHMALKQQEDGADLLDLNVGMQGVDEIAVLPQKTLLLAGRAKLPLCLDSANPKALAQALRQYPGRALVNSVSLETGKPEALFPAIQKYGAMYIALPLTESGVPEKGEDRIAIVQKILALAKTYGIPKSACAVDALAMTIAGNGDAAKEALKVIDWCKKEGINCMMGVSNTSFGLPERSGINCAMLIAARTRGMTAAILNICDAQMAKAVFGIHAILEGGSGAYEYAARFSETQKKEPGVKGSILSGETGETLAIIQSMLQEGVAPFAIVEQMIAALDDLGDLFSQKKIFLPQLMASAEAAKAGFAYLEPLMLDENAPKKATVVIATVEGDIHDIGKNIVALMLKNHGFHVVDLGRDVSNQTILQAAQEHHASIIGLSALLTTTMGNMKSFSSLLKQSGLHCKLMIGGAAVTPEYAQEIGAYYSKDAAGAVALAKQLAKDMGFSL